MNATELFHADGKPTGIYHCGKCRIVHHSQSEAEQCCTPRLCECGEVKRAYHTHCDECRDRLEREREAERFAKAEKVTEFDGFLFVDGLGYRDGYFENLEDLEDYLAGNAEDDGSQPDRPEYAWTCTPVAFCQLEYHRIIEDATQDAYEDWDSDSINGEAELKAAIELFNEANKNHIAWEPNLKKALIIPPLPMTAPTTEALL